MTSLPFRSQFQEKKKSSGLFLIPELTGPGGFAELRADCADRVSALVSEATDEVGAPARTRLVAAVFDDMSDELCRVADMAEFVRTAHPDSVVRRAAEEACIDVSGLVEKLNTHTGQRVLIELTFVCFLWAYGFILSYCWHLLPGLYNALKAAVEDGDCFPETEEDKHVAKLFLLDFQQSGIHLDDEDRQVRVHLDCLTKPSDISHLTKSG